MQTRKTPQSIDDTILKSVRATKSASTFSAKDFLHLGNPAAIRKALERLTKRGDLRRIRRGFYDRPRPHPLLGQTAPDPMDLVRGVMKDSGAQWQVSGAYAANLLHLSEQVPAKILILTDGVSRKIPLGKLTLDFRRAAPRHLLGAGKPAGLVIQAIRHLGPTGMTPAVIASLRRQLDPSTKADLLDLAPKLAAWMQPIVQQIVTPP
jgi:predicted transcriptional regulator of viral defense system